MSETTAAERAPDGRTAAGGFWRRAGAMLLKEFLQLRRDRITFATMITIPLLQLVLFGYAINTTPRDLPTAVLLQESSDAGRSILAALQNTKYFKVTQQLHDDAELDQALASGKVLFVIEIPAGFERVATGRRSGAADRCRRDRSGGDRFGDCRAVANRQYRARQ